MDTRERPSKFASVLRRMLDESGFYGRAEWAEFLGVSTAAISQWLHDRTMPSAEHIRQIVWVLRKSHDARPELLEEFERMAERPAAEVTPRHKSVGPTIGDYMITPLIDVFMHDLKRLKPTDREEFLLRASKMCTDHYLSSADLPKNRFMQEVAA